MPLFLGEEVFHLEVVGAVDGRFAVAEDCLHHVLRSLQLLTIVILEVHRLLTLQVIAQVAVLGVLLLKPHVRRHISLGVVQFVEQLRELVTHEHCLVQIVDLVTLEPVHGLGLVGVELGHLELA